MQFFLKNSDGKPSFSFTMVAVSFSVITLWLLLSIFVALGHVNIRPFSSTDAMAYFVPIAGLYYGRHQQQLAAAKSDQATPPSPSPSEPPPAA